VIGKLGKRAKKLDASRLPKLRLHARVIIADGRSAFLGSQGLRRSELDARREVGIIVRDQRTVKALRNVFESDWAETPAAQEAEEKDFRPEVREEPAAVAS
jgi:phosphatidylserine/phosphatidylglycerophosphate/cardiolipin synthase-like enzyme